MIGAFSSHVEHLDWVPGSWLQPGTQFQLSQACDDWISRWEVSFSVSQICYTFFLSLMKSRISRKFILVQKMLKYWVVLTVRIFSWTFRRSFVCINFTDFHANILYHEFWINAIMLWWRCKLSSRYSREGFQRRWFFELCLTARVAMSQIGIKGKNIPGAIRKGR